MSVGPVIRRSKIFAAASDIEDAHTLLTRTMALVGENMLHVAAGEAVRNLRNARELIEQSIGRLVIAHDGATPEPDEGEDGPTCPECDVTFSDTEIGRHALWSHTCQ
jgi:hypothetical protein